MLEGNEKCLYRYSSIVFEHLREMGDGGCYVKGVNSLLSYIENPWDNQETLPLEQSWDCIVSFSQEGTFESPPSYISKEGTIEKVIFKVTSLMKARHVV